MVMWQVCIYVNIIYTHVICSLLYINKKTHYFQVTTTLFFARFIKKTRAIWLHTVSYRKKD